MLVCFLGAVGVCVFVASNVCVCVLPALYDVMLRGLCCVFAVLVRVMVLVCDVFAWLGCDLLRGDVWFVWVFLLFVMCAFCEYGFVYACLCALFVMCCVLWHGLSLFLGGCGCFVYLCVAARCVCVWFVFCVCVPCWL